MAPHPKGVPCVAQWHKEKAHGYVSGWLVVAMQRPSPHIGQKFTSKLFENCESVFMSVADRVDVAPIKLFGDFASVILCSKMPQ
jgi:hypothetical protein